MHDYVRWWFECQDEEGAGFARYIRALKPSSAHRGVHEIWGFQHWLGLRIDYDKGAVTFTEHGSDGAGVTISVDESRVLLTKAQDAYLSR